MVTHVSYMDCKYATAAECVDGIRTYIDLGWLISQVRGPRTGPFVVLYRKDDS